MVPGECCISYVLLILLDLPDPGDAVGSWASGYSLLLEMLLD